MWHQPCTTRHKPRCTNAPHYLQPCRGPVDGGHRGRHVALQDLHKRGGQRIHRGPGRGSEPGSRHQRQAMVVAHQRQVSRHKTLGRVDHYRGGTAFPASRAVQSFTERTGMGNCLDVSLTFTVTMISCAITMTDTSSGLSKQTHWFERNDNNACSRQGPIRRCC